MLVGIFPTVTTLGELLAPRISPGDIWAHIQIVHPSPCHSQLKTCQNSLVIMGIKCGKLSASNPSKITIHPSIHHVLCLSLHPSVHCPFCPSICQTTNVSKSQMKSPVLVWDEKPVKNNGKNP